MASEEPIAGVQRDATSLEAISLRFRSGNRWRIEEPTEHEWEKLEADLAQGRLPQFERVKLL